MGEKSFAHMFAPPTAQIFAHGCGTFVCVCSVAFGCWTLGENYSPLHGSHSGNNHIGQILTRFITGILENPLPHRPTALAEPIANGSQYKFKTTSPEQRREILKLLYLVQGRICEKWTMPLHNWGLTLSQLYILFEDRIRPHLTYS